MSEDWPEDDTRTALDRAKDYTLLAENHLFAADRSEPPLQSLEQFRRDTSHCAAVGAGWARLADAWATIHAGEQGAAASDDDVVDIL